MSTSIRCSIALTVIFVASISAPLRSEAQEAKAKSKAIKDQNKAAKDIDRLVTSVAKAKGKALEEATQLCIDFDAKDKSIRRVLCEASFSNPKSRESLLGVLDKLSAPAGLAARRLFAVWTENAGNPKQLFESYDNAFKALMREKSPDTAVAPLVKSTLLDLAQIGNTTKKEVVPNDLRFKAYGSGVVLLAKLAESDDGAFGDLLYLVSLPTNNPAREEWYLRDDAIERVGRVARNHQERVDATLPVLTNILHSLGVRHTSAPGTSINAVLAGVLRDTLKGMVVHDVLDACGEIGPPAQSMVPMIRMFEGHPTFGKTAERALGKIGRP
jgi:hypothetical protein